MESRVTQIIPDDPPSALAVDLENGIAFTLPSGLLKTKLFWVLGFAQIYLALEMHRREHYLAMGVFLTFFFVSYVVASFSTKVVMRDGHLDVTRGFGRLRWGKPISLNSVAGVGSGAGYDFFFWKMEEGQQKLVGIRTTMKASHIGWLVREMNFRLEEWRAEYGDERLLRGGAVQPALPSSDL